MMNRQTLISLLLLASGLSHAADQLLSPNAPKDKPVDTATPQQLKFAIAPYVAKARATYPAAKRRFQAGLPKGEHFFLTTTLKDTMGREENIFVAVFSIRNGVVSGRIWNDVRLALGYKNGDNYSFPEASMIDWLITKQDGTEEGNFVGKFLDTYNPNGH